MVDADAGRLLDPSLYSGGDPFALYAELRRTAPVCWVDRQGGGFWAVTTHPEVASIGADPVRFCSSRILGREALGLGDVTLMGMIGTFLGWQPTVFVFLAAPLCGLALLIPVKVLWRRSHVPYGPFLAAGTGCFVQSEILK